VWFFDEDGRLPLVGGVQAVTLGDKEANASNNCQKASQFYCLAPGFSVYERCSQEHMASNHGQQVSCTVSILGVQLPAVLCFWE
jgi:hypothetical protein